MTSSFSSGLSREAHIRSVLLLIPETALRSRKKKSASKMIRLSNSWKKDRKNGKMHDLKVVRKEIPLLKRVL